MNRYIFLILSLCSLPACGGGNETDSGSSSTGGSTGDGDMATEVKPTPDGPGLDASVADSCEDLACEGSRIGSWTLDQRCDESGSYQDPACPSASFSWTLTSATGSVEFGEPLANWNVTTNHSWEISVPPECGACDYQSEWMGGLSNVSCAEDAGGGCSCSATSSWVQAWTGTVYAAVGDGHWNFRERETQEQVENGEFPPEHEFWTCAHEDSLIIYDEIGARLSFSRVPE